MSTFFHGEGNIGADAEFKEFANGNNEPRRLMRLNVRFDNSIPVKDGYEDRGGFWSPVEIWHANAEHWSTLYKRGMRVMVSGKLVSRQYTEKDTQTEKTIFVIEARSIGILPHRIEQIILTEKSQDADSTKE